MVEEQNNKYDKIFKIDKKNKKLMMKNLYLYTQKGMIFIVIILGWLSVIKNILIFYFLDKSLIKDYYGSFNYFYNILLFSPYIYLEKNNDLIYWIKEIPEMLHNYLALLFISILIILIINRYIEILIYTNDLTIYSLEVTNINNSIFRKLLKENSMNSIKKLETNYNEIINVLLTKSSFEELCFERINIMDYEKFINKNFIKKDKIQSMRNNNISINQLDNTESYLKKRNLSKNESNIKLNLNFSANDNSNLKEIKEDKIDERILDYKNRYIDIFKGFFAIFYDLNNTKELYTFYKLDIIKDKWNYFNYIKKNDNRKFILESISDSEINFCKDFYDLNIQNIEKKDSLRNNIIFLAVIFIIIGLTIFIQVNQISSTFVGRFDKNINLFLSDWKLYLLQILTLIIYNIIKTLYETYVSQKKFKYYSEVTNIRDIKSFFIDIIGGLFFYIISFTISINISGLDTKDNDTLKAFRVKLNYNIITISLTNFGIYLLMKIGMEIIFKILEKKDKNKKIAPISAFQKQNEKIKYYNVSNNTIIISKVFSYLGFVESRYSNIIFIILLIFLIIDYFLEKNKLLGKKITYINIQNVISMPILSLLGYTIGVILGIIYNYIVIKKESPKFEYEIPLNVAFSFFLFFIFWLFKFFSYNNLLFIIQNKLLFSFNKDCNENNYKLKGIRKMDINLNEYAEKINYKIKNIYEFNYQWKEFLEVLKKVN